MSEKIPGVEFITEQQLRRYALDDLPELGSQGLGQSRDQT